jgi:hypothetical protein
MAGAVMVTGRPTMTASLQLESTAAMRAKVARTATTFAVRSEPSAIVFIMWWWETVDKFGIETPFDQHIL